jgi:hypothetical protein
LSIALAISSSNIDIMGEPSLVEAKASITGRAISGAASHCSDSGTRCRTRSQNCSNRSWYAASSCRGAVNRRRAFSESVVSAPTCLTAGERPVLVRPLGNLRVDYLAGPGEVTDQRLVGVVSVCHQVPHVV